MKNKSIWVFILFLQLSTSVQAQPTIDSSWYYPFSTFSTRNNAFLWAIGNGGIGQSWDFSSASLTFGHYLNINYSPAGFNWGTNTADYQFDYFTSFTFPSDYVKYYEGKSADSLVQLGSSSMSWPGGGTTYSSSTNYTDPVIILKFPFSYQSSTIDSFVMTRLSSSSGASQSSSIGYIKGQREILVDGFGDLVLPDGLHSSSFRIKYIDTFIDSSWVPFPGISTITSRTRLTYSYWTTDNGILQKRYVIEWDSLFNGATPSFSTLNAKYYSGISLVDLEENNYNSKNVIVYPNPVLEYSSIKTPGILIKKSTLEIYNSISGLAFELSIVPTEVDRINFETNGLAPGYYKAVIRQDDKVWTAGFIKQ